MMAPDDVRAQLRDSKFLVTLDETQREALLELASIVDIPEPGSVVVREGTPSQNFYWIIEGEAEVSKLDTEKQREFTLTTLGPNDHFGETSLVQTGMRTATIRAKTPLRLAMIRARPVRDAPQEHTWLAPFLLGLVRTGSQRIDRLTSQNVDGRSAEIDVNHRELALTRVLIFAILGVALYGLGLATALDAIGPGLLRIIAVFVLGLGLFGAMYKTVVNGPYPWSFFGVVSPPDLRRTIVESAALTVAGLGLLSVLGFSIARARGLETVFHTDGDTFVGAVLLLAVIFASALEELCVRGVLQSALVDVFRGHEQRLLFAIVLSNALFAVAHTAVSANFALIQFALGLVWGYAYSRQHSLAGVFVARVLVGFFALRILYLHELTGMGS